MIYKEGKFKYRTKTGACKYFSGVCPVNRLQRNPEEDVCLTFCIPSRDDRKARKKGDDTKTDLKKFKKRQQKGASKNA